MKTRICILFVACLFIASRAPLFAAPAADEVNGTWTFAKTNASGAAWTQTVELKDGKFTFRIANDGKTIFYAKGDFKIQSVDLINVLSFNHIEAGASEDNLQPSDDVRQCVYVVARDTMTFALDFDKDRGKAPRLEVYTRKP